MIDEGIKQSRIALSLQPGYAEAYNNLGVAYGTMGLFSQAKENFEHAIRMKSDYFEAYYNLMLLYKKMGDFEKAATLYHKAKVLNPAVVLP
jgi:tetratricopeptide (TPR) repeat protein